MYLQRCRCLLALVAGCMLAASIEASANDRGSLPPVTDRREDGTGKVTHRFSEFYAKSYALVVVGITDYKLTSAWKKLPNAVEDAAAVRDALQKHGFEVTYRINLNMQQLEEEIRSFFAGVGEEENARLLFWFAGHGETSPDKLEGFMLPSDALDRSDRNFRLFAFPMEKFRYYLRSAKAKHVMAIIDACFSGKIFTENRDRAGAAPPPPDIIRNLERKSRRIIAAGGADEKVKDSGLLRRLFIEAISGKTDPTSNKPVANMFSDGYLTGHELFRYIHSEVTRQTGHAQNPDHAEVYTGPAGDFIFRISAASAGERPLVATIPAMVTPRKAPSLSEVVKSCIKAEVSPGGDATARRLVEGLRGRQIEHTYHFATTAQAQAEEMPHGLKGPPTVVNNEIHLEMQFAHAKVVLVPVVDDKPPGRQPVVRLRGGFVSSSAYGCVELRYNEQSGIGEGLWEYRNLPAWKVWQTRKVVSTLKVSR